jgi:hypothetical protein
VVGVISCNRLRKEIITSSGNLTTTCSNLV